MHVASLILLATLGADESAPVVIGAKAFTESEVLREVAAALGGSEGVAVEQKMFAGTIFAWRALLAGEIDVYPEYTGTLRQEIFAGRTLPDHAALRAALAEHGLRMADPLGFNNSYALAMREEEAARLGIRTVSDLKDHPRLRLGFSEEFTQRNDGWPSLSQHYGLPQTDVEGMEHGVAYQALRAGEKDVTDAYTTDAKVRMFHLRVLEDDLGYFPRYHAVFIYRDDLARRAPQFVASLRGLSGRIDEAKMLTMNERVEVDHVSVPRVAAEFLNQEFGLDVEVVEASLMARVWRRTLEHLYLVLMSLAAAIAVAVPLGILAAKHRLTGQVILGVAEVIQTIPGLALLVFIGAAFSLVALRMTGPTPCIAALFLYALLPIIRNTVAGLNGVPASLMESARALGLPPLARLWLIELPLASRMILAGIKTTAVITVGYAALGALIAAGGYGAPIMTGLRLYSVPLMMEGAVPAAVMALAVKGLFELCERWVVPQGLRVAS